ncbi:hypothetical protein [Fundidesulfovibrio soli]|uniref:hypothetical protein n=1 Tax=Fundidesulfovibrio soli TaxID=2922716 RepID=UPI001FAFF4E3|nr:hypothetical protein [Fundidesulfovibrio soli]
MPTLTTAGAEGLPAGVRLFDPGVAEGEGDADRFTPANLPMARPVAKAMLAQFVQLARESKTVADVSAFASGVYEDFHRNTTHAIRDQLQAAVQGEDAAAKARERALSKAQTELCLAWALEEVARELKGLEARLDDQWKTFEQTLGMDGEDALDDDGLGLVEGKPSLVPSGPSVPSRVILDAVLAFLPDACGLLSRDAALRADWEEFGVAFAPASEATLARFGLGGEGAWLEAVAEGRRLCLSRRTDPEKPWQARSFTVVVPAGS